MIGIQIPTTCSVIYHEVFEQKNHDQAFDSCYVLLYKFILTNHKHSSLPPVYMHIMEIYDSTSKGIMAPYRICPIGTSAELIKVAIADFDVLKNQLLKKNLHKNKNTEEFTSVDLPENSS